MISVIIPVHNVEKYLYVCLNSILQQSYQNFEIICIDDSSTDSSLDILEYFAGEDSRIKILKNESNCGIGFSRNKGLNMAQGEYIIFLEGDDWLRLNTFEILIKNARKNNLDLLMFNCNAYSNNFEDFDENESGDFDFLNKFENKVFNHKNVDKTKLFFLQTKFIINFTQNYFYITIVFPLIILSVIMAIFLFYVKYLPVLIEFHI